MSVFEQLIQDLANKKVVASLLMQKSHLTETQIQQLVDEEIKKFVYSLWDQYLQWEEYYIDGAKYEKTKKNHKKNSKTKN